MTTSSDSVLFEGLEENSVYSVSVIAITFDLTRSVSAADISTLTAGKYTGSYFAQGGYLSSYYLYIAPSAAPRDLTSHTVASTSILLTWKNIDCIQHNGVLTGFDVKYYRQVDGELATTIVGSSYTTSYTVGGLFPYSEYWFRIAAVNSDGPGPYTAFIGPIRTNEYGGLDFISLIYNFNSLTKILCSTRSCVRSDRLCQVLLPRTDLESSTNA